MLAKGRLPGAGGGGKGEAPAKHRHNQPRSHRTSPNPTRKPTRQPTAQTQPNTPGVYAKNRITAPKSSKNDRITKALVQTPHRSLPKAMLLEKFKETLMSVLPIVAIVLVLNFTLVPLDPQLLGRFALGTVSLIAGLAVFLLGVEIGLTPVGNLIGHAIARSNKVAVVLVSSLVVGLFVTVAEPDLHIYGASVDNLTGGAITKMTLVVVVSIGIAVMLTVGMMRIVRNFSLRAVLLAAYLLVGILAIFAPPEYLAVSFDASGATTGALTVPFVLAMAAGVSAMKKDSSRSEADAFGLVAIASVGAILSVLITSLLVNQGQLSSDAASVEIADISAGTAFAHFFLEQLHDVALGMFPIVVTFGVGAAFLFEVSRRKMRRIWTGMGVAFVGLVLFLTGVNTGFMDVGRFLGQSLAEDFDWRVLLGVAFVLGLVTILAEPAVYVLMNQVEDVTSGSVRRSSVMSFLAVGVGLAVVLSTARVIVEGMELWHILLPGYLIALALMFFVPELFVGIAFDSGGVASGPMTATFVLAFSQGAAAGTPGSDVVLDGLGVIAGVAMTPLIALQLLGLIYRLKTARVDRRRRLDVWLANAEEVFKAKEASK